MSKETRIKRVTTENLGKMIDTLGADVKEILAAKSLNDNAEYTIIYEYTLPSLSFEEPGEGDDLKGATLTDLQTDVTIASGKIEATLPYMEGYTGYSENPEEQEGHYIAVKGTTNADVVTMIFDYADGTRDIETAYIDDDEECLGVVIKRIANDNLVKITVVEYDKDYNEDTFTEYKCDLTYEPKVEPDDSDDDTPGGDDTPSDDDTTPDTEGGSDNTEGGAE